MWEGYWMWNKERLSGVQGVFCEEDNDNSSYHLISTYMRGTTMVPALEEETDGQRSRPRASEVSASGFELGFP